ncbi:hypothetical protein B9Z19DRAFT_1120853 [Tuber borchii]|uniref:Fungal N-terminal domain-containing protein n=1 Tax=Tuber borchii TaxID=42251 RepID=A0A2T7A3S1_TUBBO|nr:hypothetical protein B9Z19DRAFT_1120853 [Tuber borchii]
MDPLSVVSGIVGTVAVGAKVLMALREFGKGVKSAPEELKLLTRELEALHQIMDNFRKKTGGATVNEHTVSEKDGFLKKGWKQVKWHYIEKDIADLRVCLNSNKGNLLVALTLANELQNGHSYMKLERVQGALEEVIERLQDHDMQTVATCESFTLRRWQEVPSTPTIPNDQISVARSDSGIFSEAGFSVRSISMSAYQFNDMETRGKGFLISDGTHTKAYTVEARKQKEGLDSKQKEVGVPMAGSSGRSSKPPTKPTKPAPLNSIPEPEEEDEVPNAKDDSKLGGTHAKQLEVRQIQALAGSDRSIARLGDSLGMRGAIALAIPALEMYRHVARSAKDDSKLVMVSLFNIVSKHVSDRGLGGNACQAVGSPANPSSSRAR